MSETLPSSERKKAKPTTVTVNNRPVTLPDDHATGSEILAAAGVPFDFKLYLHKGKKLELVDPNEQIKVHAEDKFTAVSGQDVS
ncbi:multiubiquitin domain-containing protein [Baekduia sp.]|jgi:hypothetical protein|uniref:multiubiquitin domain-containing protein n=1 Tax=Baekduia sp. TaxID=2600305 RepID=UPI002E0843CA|nr:multiubiquitin domain-containing protein [Baekduia sp.]